MYCICSSSFKRELSRHFCPLSSIFLFFFFFSTSSISPTFMLLFHLVVRLPPIEKVWVNLTSTWETATIDGNKPLSATLTPKTCRSRLPGRSTRWRRCGEPSARRKNAFGATVPCPGSRGWSNLGVKINWTLISTPESLTRSSFNRYYLKKHCIYALPITRQC